MRYKHVDCIYSYLGLSVYVFKILVNIAGPMTSFMSLEYFISLIYVFPISLKKVCSILINA